MVADNDDQLPLDSPNWRLTADSIDLLYRQLGDAELAQAEHEVIAPRQKWVARTGDPPRIVHRLVGPHEVTMVIRPTVMTGPARLEEGWRHEIEYEVDGEPREGQLFDWKPDFDRYYGVPADPGGAGAADSGLERTAPIAPPLEPVATVPASPHAGGPDPQHDWESACRHVDAEVAKKGPLPRRKNGTPNFARAIGLMQDWFKRNSPPPPTRESFYRWFKNNPRRHRAWWNVS